jgi:HAMP domain-containing protein
LTALTLLLSTYAAILPFVPGLAAIIAWFSARHFLRHLEGLADAADQVSIQNLHDRVPNFAPVANGFTAFLAPHVGKMCASVGNQAGSPAFRGRLASGAG